MKRAVRRRNRRRRERSSLQLLEEAFHLLRTAPITSLWIFYLGAVPFVAAFMYFVADMSRSSYAMRDSTIAAMLMVGAFLWMKFFQAKFCASLWDTINPGQTPKQSGWQKFRYTAALWCLQAFTVPALFIGTFFLIPLGWIVAALQNFSVLAFTQDYGRQPLRKLMVHGIRNSHYEWAQNHGVLLILGFIALFMWINIIGTCIMVPTFAKSFFGIDSLFSINPQAAIGNTTFLFGTLLINWLLLSPVLKAVYLLRCFYADSRRTGDDLLSRLASCREQRDRENRSGSSLQQTKKTGGKAASILIGAGCFFLLNSPDRAVAQESAVTPEAAETSSSQKLEKAIADTMEQKQYQWRLSRKQTGEDIGKEDTWIARKLTEIADSIESAAKRLKEWLEKLNERFRKKKKTNTKPSSDGFSFPGLEGLGSFTTVLLTAIVIGLLGWLIVILARNYRAPPLDDHDDAGSGGGIVDLEDEDIVASDLPEDEWMKLAKEQISKGETRLAIRALFLASLAHLGDRGMLNIARFKSNRDYRGELELRARHEVELREAFDENTNLFERVWYGLHQLGEDAVDHFMSNYEKISEKKRDQEATSAEAT